MGSLPPSSSANLRAVLLVAGGWLGCMEIVGRFTWGHGKQTFVMLVASAFWIALAKPIGRQLARCSAATLLRFVLAGLLCARLIGLGRELHAALELPRNENWAVDIAVNTHLAGSAFLRGENPYATRAQAWHRIPAGPNVVVEGESVTMFGLPYDYGFPYFPAMMLGYLPGRMLDPGLDGIRLWNGLLLLVNLAGIAWLAARIARRGERLNAALLGCLLYTSVSVTGAELFQLAVTDIFIATWALFGFIALSYGRNAAAGLLWGIGQACKLLPGPLLVIPALLWLTGHRERFRMAGAFITTASLLILPFFLWDPARFITSTVLFYATFHAGGDNTSLWYFLPTALQRPFRLLGLLLTVVAAAAPFFRSRTDLLVPVTQTFVAYLLFIAFNNMTHLNYLWGVFPLGCVSVAVLAIRAGSESAPAPESESIAST